MSIPYKGCLSNLPKCRANCCKNGVWVDLEEAKIIEKKVNNNSAFSDLHGKTLFEGEIDDPDYCPSGKAIGVTLKTKKGPCIFLGDDFKCRIYSFRPFFCADYPLMHPLSTSKEPILIDNMFESDKKCIYHGLLKNTEKSIKEEEE